MQITKRSGKNRIWYKIPITNGPEIHMSQAPAQPQAQVQQPNFSAAQQPQAQIQPVMQQPVQQAQPSFGGFGTVNQVQQPVQSSSYTMKN